MNQDAIPPINITGTWLHANEVPMGPGSLRIRSQWQFHDDGTAQLQATSCLIDGAVEVTLPQVTQHAERYRIEGSRIIVDVPGHSDSPIRLTLISSGQFKSRGAVFHRVAS
jgi:hypothetical protein